MEKIKVYIPVGIVASGKSTACRKWAEEKNAVIVEADVFRSIFYRKYVYDPATEPMIWNFVFTATAEWVSNCVNVAVDDAVFFLKKKDRLHFEVNLANRVRVPYRVIWDFLPVPTDEEVAERRGREGRGYSVDEWLEVAQRQRTELEID